MLAEITGVRSLPRVDFRTLSNETSTFFDVDKRGILDILLSVVAKVLRVQVKAKNGSNGKESRTIVMADFIDKLTDDDVDTNRWYLKGGMSKELAVEADTLLKDMTKGKISESWREIAKASIAENILNLANLSKVTKNRKDCLHYVTFWIGLASLSVVDEDHVEKLSSTNWRNENNETTTPRPLCANHDDQKTLGVMQCNVCGLLCVECDRFLHLNRKTLHHERRICKEEEEAIKVDVHEGCGRVKLFWLLALVDSNTFKGVVEFRENSRLMRPAENDGVNGDLCRFCGRQADKSSKNNVCADDECLEHAANACTKAHRCGHVCGGIKNEEKCLPCLHGCTGEGASLKQDADDMCMICFTEALSAAPSIQLDCGHVFHYHCCKNVLLKRWAGPRITFNFQQCPICKRSIYHDSMEKLLSPVWNLMKEVRKKALMRLEYEGCPSNYDDPAMYAMEKYAYYVCFKCNKAYYGGEARCEAEVDNSDFNPEELICGGCSDVSGARVCPKHGTDFLEYKCRYCCSVAVYFCFGTTHFCNACHEDFQKVISLLPSELPSCPAGPKGTSLNTEDCPLHIKHPPTGEEFALGCGVCRTGRNF